MSAKGSRVFLVFRFLTEPAKPVGSVYRLYLALLPLPGRTLREQCQQHRDDNPTVMLQLSRWGEGGAGNEDGSH